MKAASLDKVFQATHFAAKLSNEQRKLKTIKSSAALQNTMLEFPAFFELKLSKLGARTSSQCARSIADSSFPDPNIRMQRNVVVPCSTRSRSSATPGLASQRTPLSSKGHHSPSAPSKSGSMWKPKTLRVRAQQCLAVSTCI